MYNRCVNRPLIGRVVLVCSMLHVVSLVCSDFIGPFHLEFTRGRKSIKDLSSHGS